MNKIASGKAFTLVEIMIAMAVIGIAAAIAIPSYVRSRAMANRSVCISNQRHVREAVDMWALDANAATGVVPSRTDLVPSYARSWPSCMGTAYEIPAVGSNPVCPNGIVDHQLENQEEGG